MFRLSTILLLSNYSFYSYTSSPILWYAMNELMHVMQSWFLGYMDGHYNHLPWLNHGWKIECLQYVWMKGERGGVEEMQGMRVV